MMELGDVEYTVEAPRDDVASAALLEEPAVAHVDACIPGHECVRILDQRVALRVLELLVLVGADTIELEQPVTKPVRRLHLAGTHLVRLRAPGNDGLGTRPAGRG